MWSLLVPAFLSSRVLGTRPHRACFRGHWGHLDVGRTPTTATTWVTSLPGVRKHQATILARLLPSNEDTVLSVLQIDRLERKLAAESAGSLFFGSDHPCAMTIDSDIYVSGCRYAGRLISKLSEPLDPRRMAGDRWHFAQQSRRIWRAPGSSIIATLEWLGLYGAQLSLCAHEDPVAGGLRGLSSDRWSRPQSSLSPGLEPQPTGWCGTLSSTRTSEPDVCVSVSKKFLPRRWRFGGFVPVSVTRARRLTGSFTASCVIASVRWGYGEFCFRSS